MLMNVLAIVLIGQLQLTDFPMKVRKPIVIEYPLKGEYPWLTFAPDESRVVCCTTERTAGLVLELPSKKELVRLAGNHQWSNATMLARFAPDGSVLYLADHRWVSVEMPVGAGFKSRDSYQGEILRWDTKTGRQLPSWPCPPGRSAAALTVLADGRLVTHEWRTDEVTGAQLSSLGIYDPKTGVRRELAKQNMSVVHAQKHNLLITSDPQYDKIHVHNGTSLQRIKSVEVPKVDQKERAISSPVVSHDGDYLLVPSINNIRVTLYKLPELTNVGERTATPNAHGIGQLVCLVDGKFGYARDGQEITVFGLTPNLPTLRKFSLISASAQTYFLDDERCLLIVPDLSKQAGFIDEHYPQFSLALVMNVKTGKPIEQFELPTGSGGFQLSPKRKYLIGSAMGKSILYDLSDLKAD